MSDSVRFGLIGFGLFGKHHAAAIERTSGAELVAIAVRSEQSQHAAQQTHPRAEIYGDYERLCARQDIDIISVVTSNELHYEIARAALEAGKHVLLEKPMALQLEHCDTLIKTAEQHQRILAIGHELRLSSLWGRVRQLIDEGAIGEAQHVMIELSRFPYRLGSQGWRYDQARVGSWILEEPIHFFDLARWYLESAGDPVSVYARGNARDASRPELLDNFSTIVNHANGAYAVISQTLSAFGHHQTAKVAGRKGTIWAWWSAADARSERPAFQLRYGLAEQVHEVACDKPAGELLELADEIAALVQCVRGQRRPPCDGRDGRWSTRLCLAAEESLDTGSIVRLSD